MKMIKYNIILLILLLLPRASFAGLLINEIACNTSGDDWVELFYYDTVKDKIDISNLYVTMYYGSAENISADPVHIYSYDRPETPYDDRFIVVHLTSLKPDETDLTGDTNQNGYIDVYRNNYSANLWSTDCVVAIDTDDDPANCGIIDFAAYSNYDTTPDDSIKSYTEYAQNCAQWPTVSGTNIQECMVNIGSSLESYSTISRKNYADTNSQSDFAVTKFATPGKENITDDSAKSNKLFRPLKTKISYLPDSGRNLEVELFIYEQCDIKLRIFSDIGMLIYESQLFSQVIPGNFKIQCASNAFKKKMCTGLHIANIEATNNSLKKSNVENIYIITKSASRNNLK